METSLAAEQAGQVVAGWLRVFNVRGRLISHHHTDSRGFENGYDDPKATTKMRTTTTIVSNVFGVGPMSPGSGSFQ
jgi:hypothetical protein